MLQSLNFFVRNRIGKPLKLLIHRGEKYLCPFCHYASRDLAVIGMDLTVLKEKQVVGGGTRSGGCFRCGSMDRERLIYIYLKEKLHLFESREKKSILHIAPESQLSQKLLKCEFINYVCGDLFAPGYVYPAHVRNMDILAIPYEEETFDIVICNHVLEHIPDDAAAMREIFRVLKKDGLAILQVPISKNSPRTFEDFSVIDPKKREEIFGQYDHLRIYGQDYPHRLESAGFEVQRVRIAKEYVHFGLNEEEDIFVARK